MYTELAGWATWSLGCEAMLAAGSESVLTDAIAALNSVEQAAKVAGLELNRAKCEVLGKGEWIKELAAITNTVGFGNPQEWAYLGCPLGPAMDDHSSFKVALDKCEKLGEAIAQLECPEAQLALHGCVPNPAPH